MSDALSDDITLDFLNELKDYVPLLRDKVQRINKLDIEASDKDLTELHRLVHAIRGASALIKLNNLSEVAAEFEAVVEELQNKRLIFDSAVSNCADTTIDYFEAYAKQAPCNDECNQGLRSRVLISLHDARQRVSCDDRQNFLSRLLETADLDQDGSFGFDTDDLSFDDFHDPSDLFISAEDDIAPLPGQTGLENALSESEKKPKGPTHLTMGDAHAGDTEEPESIDLLQDELLEGFYQEAEDHFQNLAKAIGRLEERISAPATVGPDEKEVLRLIRRSVHTIKGAASVVKLKAVASWGHEFENLLDWLYEGAERIGPHEVEIIADATDMLERYVTDPPKADPGQVIRLKKEFKRIIGSVPDEELADADGPDSEPNARSAGFDESSIYVEDRTEPNTPPSALDQTKTIRIDSTKVTSLVNLGGELTIALSAFDQDMEGLANLIGEIDRTQSRLKQTARDLELGYELKAIGKMDTALPVVEDAAIGEQRAACSEFDLLELDRYSELNLIIRSLSETADDAGTISHQLSKIYSGFKGYLHHLQILLGDLNEKTMRMRMTPMSSIANRLHRTVRETASQLGKKVLFAIIGEHIELDKMMWYQLVDALMHLLRNAVDHGIESPAARKKAGKPETAVVRLQAAYQGNQVVLRISDDGAGLDYDAIGKAVPARQPGNDDKAVAPEELADMIFQPGFSTRRTVSEVSGRGVGLDVVRENITGLKGSVHVEKSEKGAGTTFIIKLPLTVAVMKALLFDVGPKRYATALYDINEVLRVSPKNMEILDDNTIDIGGRRLPYYKISDILAGPDFETQTDDTADHGPIVLIIRKESWQGAVAIDRIYGKRDIVIKSLGTHLGRVKGISGATVMGDGRVVPILNLEELLRTETVRSHKSSQPEREEEIQKPLQIMVVDDSVTIRNVVSRLMKRQGWSVLTAKDGLEAMEAVYTRQPDLIILDIEMPRMNGYEFLRSMRAQEAFKGIPVVMHTSRGSQKHRKKAELLGANGFVTKPYKEEDFIAIVKDLSRRN